MKRGEEEDKQDEASKREDDERENGERGGENTDIRRESLGERRGEPPSPGGASRHRAGR